MSVGYIAMKYLHLLTAAISITLFLMRYFWKCRDSAMMEKRWVKITPHVNDTLLLVSGSVLIFVTGFYPFSPQGTWLTEKLFSVIIYILLGYVALGKRHSQNIRWLVFILALGCLYLVVKLATTKLPLLMGYL
jgi:uncharacterized membrane protein SirB2